MANELFRRREHNEAIRYLRGAEASLRESAQADSMLECYILTHLALCIFSADISRAEESLTLMDVAISKAERWGPLCTADAMSVKASALSNLDRHVEAAGILEKCLTLADGETRSERVGLILSNLGAVYFVMGEREKSLQCLCEARMILQMFPDGLGVWLTVAAATGFADLDLDLEA